MALTVDMRSGLRAVGALRSEGQASDEPIALETAVVATGARPGDSAAKRELFSEDTQTVLVFERGAVIRLSAAVADGQLLFLTNKKTGKEVVTQVMRKRSFRPTSCYVDLEFTEPCPGFWGIDFPKAAPLQPSDSSSAKLSDEGDPDQAPAPPAPRPDLQEVERLKKEVSELQSKLKSLTANGQETQAQRVMPDARLNLVAVAGPVEKPESEELARKQQEEEMLQQLFAQETQQELLQGPKIRVTSSRKSSGTKKAGKLAAAGVFAAIAVAGALAAYRFGMLDSLLGRAVVRPAVQGDVSRTVKPQASPERALVSPQLPASSNAVSGVVSKGTEAKGSAQSESQSAVADAGAAAFSAAAAPLPSASPENPVQSFRAEIKRDAGHGRAGLSAVPPASTVLAPVDHAGPAAVENGSVGDADPADYVAAKLVRAVKPVSPPDALRNYITGNVTVDALVDATGRVRNVTVLAGPLKLRNTAIEEMKQYVYEPARKNGKPVTSHVQASLQFWYEP